MSAFDRVVGYESIKKEFKQVLDMFRNPELYVNLGAKLPKGMLIDGDPGLGKTLMCSCFIEESGLPSYTVRRTSGDSEFISSITAAFKEAAEHAPSIVFLDDLDKFADTGENDHDRNASEFVAVQAGIDSVKAKDVFVIATTNDSDRLPRSLVRTGRFDRFISVNQPTAEDAVRILKYYMKDKHVDPDLNFEDVVKMLGNDTVCTLETIINEAAILAGYERASSIQMKHILDASLKLQYHCTENDFADDHSDEYEARAVHEAGHAAISEILMKGSIGLASIRRGDGAACEGFVHACKTPDRRPYQIMIALAGKVGSELLLPRTASGCSSDLGKARRSIESGISCNATLGYALLDPAMEDSSSSLRRCQEAASAAELERYACITRELLLRNMDFFTRLRDALLEKGCLLYSDIQKIRSTCEIKGYEL